mmetsp:Transcript_61700/g.97808  ORF Transcript_61700/g.97808 Transcript_61700/m.97808 type:complete len:82 (+) Transcript_61700:156-401(+)
MRHVTHVICHPRRGEHGEDGADGEDGRLFASAERFTMLLARFASFNALAVSQMVEWAGEQFTYINAFAPPPMASCSSCVSL